MKTSNCCDSTQIDDYDLCPKCKEHCGWYVECEACEGNGEGVIEEDV